jgi:cell division protein ZapA (FtsZ GTPase activity inhibitor)
LHRIRILGRELQVRNPGSSERVRKIESYINNKVAEVEKSTTATDPQIIAVLTLLNIVESFIEACELNDSISRSSDERLSSLVRRVEEVLG